MYNMYKIKFHEVIYVKEQFTGTIHLKKPSPFNGDGGWGLYILVCKYSMQKCKNVRIKNQ